MDSVLQDLLDAVTQHIPSGVAWLPILASVGLTAMGFVLLAKGAKLAPLMTAFVFLGAGGVGGSYVAHWFNIPVWPTMLGGGVIAFIGGLALFRVWLAAMVSMCFVGASLTFYGAKVLQPHLVAYESRGLDLNGLVTLPPPSDVVEPVVLTATQELTGLWNYLSEAVPNFQPSFYAIVISAGLAGLIFGLLVSALSRALWAATTGISLFGLGAYLLLQSLSPGALAWLQSLGPWTWGAVIGVWSVSLVFNLMDCRQKRPEKKDEEDEEAVAATA